MKERSIVQDSEKRIQFIADYISAYEEKIRLLNINGLFDSAKLFELFAIEVGSLYYGQRLVNLNVNTYTYPCVDLISADKQIHIQVSTAKDIPSKIRTTLENIRDSKLDEINTLTNVKFIVLSNSSIDKVKDYIGKDQIGRIPFTKKEDLITTNDILQKAMSDLDFQIALFDLLKKEAESIRKNSYMLQEAIASSKSVGLSNIDSKINDEYEIDRSELLSKIETENHKNISIQGGAGSGKSVLCKMFVENEENLLYARAERFREETDINKIWGIDIKQTLEYLSGKPIVFFIDSLEFIADVPTKLDLLQTLYEYTKDYPVAKIITSCRTSDKNAFMKIESIYSIHSYEIIELASKEQFDLACKYPIIKKMLDMNSYVELLKSPFYINLIISKVADIDNISDENDLREYIWRHIICLDDNETAKVIKSIVFSRAQNFSLGAIRTDYDTKTIEKLISTGVLVGSSDTIRLKYDIFEDICFEQYLDNTFNKCKGKYNVFFDEIETFGRCIFRRYQIWIANKLFAKNNREKFLYQLIFSDKIPPHWKKQTEIGLVKSRHCDQFFVEYGKTIIENGIINDFTKITNLYAFEIISNYPRLSSYVRLRPSGEGRKCLIHLIVDNELYNGDKVSPFDIEKLCTDYSKTQKLEKNTAKEACLILEFIIEKRINMTEVKDYYKIDDDLNRLLTPVYQMAEHAKEWIIAFWLKLTSFYKSENSGEVRLASDIIEDTIQCKHVKLAKYLAPELCGLAEMFWTHPCKKERHYGFYERDRQDISYAYGFNENAEQYEHGSTRNTAIDNNFFFFLFKTNFWVGLDWTISFVNNAVLRFAKKHKDLPTYEINFIEVGIQKSYYGYENMWLATTQEHNMPMIIGDLLYCLKAELFYVISNDAVADNKTIEFAENLKKHIYEKSNNIALLAVIADIGMEFRQKLPGYALDMATNITLILHDLTRLTLSIKNPAKEMLEKQIMMTVGIPYPLPDRYNKKDAKQYDLLTYVSDSQIFYGEEVRERCHKILDYLYSIVPNNEDDAISYLQIQKMDLRTAQAVTIDDTTIALIPSVTGEAKKITNEKERKRQPEAAILSIVNECIEKINKNEFELDDCLKTIDVLQETRKNTAMPESYNSLLIGFIVRALNNQELNSDTRAELCQIWIDGIKLYFSMGSFIFQYECSEILFAQVESNVCDAIKTQLKQLMLDLIMYGDSNGVVSKIAHFAKRYLASNSQLAQAMFNTVVKLAEDEMKHQKFNARYIKKHEKNKDFEFLPNMQPKLWGVDQLIEGDKKKKYQSKKSEIISEYLFNNSDFNLSNFDMNNYDIATLCYAFNCGLSLADAIFAKFAKRFVVTIIDIWKSNERTQKSHDILGVHQLFEVNLFFQEALLKSETQPSIVLDVLFEDIAFSKFTREATEFYLDVFGALLAEYFDAHNDEARRAQCEQIIYSLESKIIAIKEEKVKLELYKSLIFAITRYGGGGDWSKCSAGYSYKDRQFLNSLFSKYGCYHPEDVLNTIYKLHLDELLPEILLSVRDTFKKILHMCGSEHKVFSGVISKQKSIILIMITRAFFDFGNQIKQDDDLTKAFEGILEILTEMNYEEAATILDEFRVH